MSSDMNLVLTSDLPSTANEVVFDLMRRKGMPLKIAWIPPITDRGRKRFTIAQAQFQSHGVVGLEYCDIDEEADETRLSRLDEYDIVYLSGGDPIAFRRNILRVGLPVILQRCFAASRLVVAASGGSMQFTKNLSLFRLQGATLDKVLAERGDYEALGAVHYELLPHLNRLDPKFLETVRMYSERANLDIIALADGAAILHTRPDEYQCIGEAARFRKGVVAPIDGILGTLASDGAAQE
jgi:peptidase E